MPKPPRKQSTHPHITTAGGGADIQGDVGSGITSINKNPLINKRVKKYFLVASLIVLCPLKTQANEANSKKEYQHKQQNKKAFYAKLILKHNPSLRLDDIMHLSMTDFENYLTDAFNAEGMTWSAAKEKAHLVVQTCT